MAKEATANAQRVLESGALLSHMCPSWREGLQEAPEKRQPGAWRLQAWDHASLVAIMVQSALVLVPLRVTLGSSSQANAYVIDPPAGPVNVLEELRIQGPCAKCETPSRARRLLYSLACRTSRLSRGLHGHLTLLATSRRRSHHVGNVAHCHAWE